MAFVKARRGVRLAQGICAVRKNEYASKKSAACVTLSLSRFDADKTLGGCDWVELFQDDANPLLIGVRKSNEVNGNAKVQRPKGNPKVNLPRSIVGALPPEFVGGRYYLVNSATHQMHTINLAQPVREGAKL